MIGSVIRTPPKIEAGGGNKKMLGIGSVLLTEAVNKKTEHYVELRVNCELSFDRKITHIEYRYCHLSNPTADFFMTLGRRLLATGWGPAHHHLLMLELEGAPAMVYVDKGLRRHFICSSNKEGLNKDGDWVKSAHLKSKKVTSGITLRELVAEFDADKWSTYTLLNRNCQEYASAIYEYLE